jgi:hypothetical protein
MKKLIAIVLLASSLTTAFAQSALELSVATTLSPFVTATRILDTATAVVLAPFVSTIATLAQRRGVAGKEQIKDDLIALNDDMVAGRVSAIEEVRQPALKELLEEIAKDEAQMQNINNVVASGSQLYRVATAVTISLLSE